MRIALLLSGHLRLFEKCAKSLHTNLLLGREIDTYIHTWDTLEVPVSKEKPNGLIFTNSPTEKKLDDIQRVYHPKNIQIDSQQQTIDKIIAPAFSMMLDPGDRPGFFGGSLIHYASMLYSLKQCYKLLDGQGTYDLVIRCRPDLVFPDKLEVINQVPLRTALFTPNIAQYYSNGLNDQFAFGEQTSLHHYCNLYDELISHVQHRVCSPLRPETLMRYHIASHNIVPRMQQIRYFILRTSGTVLYPLGVNMGSTDMGILKGLI